ncbi:MAG: stage II sporulation protein M [Polyangiales bacterium]
MEGFDVNRFITQRTAGWRSLEALVLDMERRPGTQSLDDVRRFAKLYRTASSDLLLARTERVDAALVDYLNALVARAYAVVYATNDRRDRRLWQFFARAFPILFRREWKVIAVSAALLFAGAVVGAVGIALDPGSRAVLIPEQHQAFSPDERVGRDEGHVAGAGEASVFSAFLFTHNIKVTFFVFALGVTFGVGSALVLFYNGLPLGALAMQYHMAGQGLFFWAWILPHGIPELTQIFIAGGAGLMLGRGMLVPGRRRRGQALRAEAQQAVLLVVGGMPILVLAGVIEGTISQIHAPTLPYWAKLTFAGVVGVGLYAYLLAAGRREGSKTRS